MVKMGSSTRSDACLTTLIVVSACTVAQGSAASIAAMATAPNRVRVIESLLFIIAPVFGAFSLP
ncbi:MAG: hypothetical protein OHK0024_13100 [Thalassobaculales bacterium]